MRLRSAANGHVLGDRVPTLAHHRPPAAHLLPSPRCPQHQRDLQLLHERHDNGLHRRPRARHRHRALQPPHAHRPCRHEIRRLQSQKTDGRVARGDDVPVYVGVEYRVHRDDGAHYLRSAARARKGA